MPRDVISVAIPGCSDDAVSILRDCSAPTHFGKDTVLYQQNDAPLGIFIIAEGCVIVERFSRSGDVTSFRIATAGDCIGHRSFLAGEPRSTSPRCICDTTAYHVPAACLSRAIALDPAVSLALAREAARDDGPRLGAIVRNRKIPGLARLAYLIDHLWRKKRVLDAHDSGSALEIALKQSDLANLLDLRNETVSRLSHQLEDLGLLTVEPSPRRISVIDQPGLERLYAEYL